MTGFTVNTGIGYPTMTEVNTQTCQNWNTWYAIRNTVISPSTTKSYVDTNNFIDIEQSGANPNGSDLLLKVQLALVNTATNTDIETHDWTLMIVNYVTGNFTKNAPVITVPWRISNALISNECALVIRVKKQTVVGNPVPTWSIVWKRAFTLVYE